MRKLITTISALSITLAACSAGATSEEPHEHHSEHGDHHEHGAAAEGKETAERRTRIAVGTDEGVTILDESLTELATFSGTSQPRLAEASDDRHVWVVDPATGDVSAIDAGSYGVPHGDHFHYYITDPAALNLTIDMDKPAHVVTNPDVDGTAIFDDATGTAAVVSAEDLSESRPGTQVSAEYAHHGVVVPMPDGHYFVTEASEGEALPSTIELRHGTTEVEDTYECAGMHGEVAHGWNAAFGCADSVVIVRDGVPTTIDYPESAGDSRVGTLHATSDFATLVGNFGPTSLALISADTFSELNVTSEYGPFTITPDGTIVVLGTDGKLRTFSTDGEAIATIDVTAAWEKPEGHGGIAPQMSAGEFAGANMVWITEPAAHKVHAVDLFSGKVMSTDVAGQPSSIATLNDN